MITLYHGSNLEIDKIRLDLCKPGKDFGKGFYLNPNYEQAFKMAQRAKRITNSDRKLFQLLNLMKNYWRIHL